MSTSDDVIRYARQITFVGLGPEGQRAIMRSSAVIVGVGGLGSWTAELLARAGVGRLRLIDDDRVDLSNLHRQALYTHGDAEDKALKVRAAADRLGQINPGIQIECVACRVDKTNIARLTEGVDLIVDGTDNFATRFVINDYAVKHWRPWVFAGVVGAEAQVLAIRPPETACLRCLLDAPPPACTDPSCRRDGVLGPAVAAVAAIQSMEALKILSGRVGDVSGWLLKLDLWGNTVQRIRATRQDDCLCCRRRDFEFLEA